MKTRKIEICLMLVALCGAFAGAADIVHSPYAAFVANYNGETFANGPQVDANGGVWSYGYRAAVASTSLNSFSQDKFTRASSALGGMNKQVDSSFIPYIAINPTATDVTDQGASPFRPVTPGNEFVVQPGNRSAGDANCGLPVIRFAAPRTGRYSVSAVCETLANSSEDDGVTSFHLLVNGSVVEERDLAHVSGSGTTYTFAKSGILLGFGETIELVVGPGMTALRNAISYSSDSSSVKIEIVEAEAEGLFSLGDDMAANILAGNSDNPFLEGRWTAGRYDRDTENPYPQSITSLLWGFSRDTYFVGYNEDGSTTKNLYCCVNTNDQVRTALSSQEMDPHEVIIMPSGARNADVRFVTPERGMWRITARVRNLQNSTTDDDTCGVRVFLLAEGACLADELLATPGTKVSREIEVVTSRLKSGAVVDLVLDSRGNASNDPVGVKLFVEKVIPPPGLMLVVR